MTLQKIPLVAVLGSPITHSKSPLLHGYWLNKYNIKGRYVPIDVSSSNLKQILSAMPKMGFVGANVTIPHKESVLTFADQISDRASLIGAANTLSFMEGGKIYADNTDGVGFMENIRHNAPNWKPQIGPAMLLGAGGAARAVVASLLESGVPEIWITNRTKVRAEQFVADFGARLKIIDWVNSSQVLGDVNILINSTSLGMVDKPPLNINLDRLSQKSLVTDLVYTPLETRLLTTARKKGCDTVDGLGMLIHQAVAGFTRWFGQKPEADQATRDVLLNE
jgi:shikimate dehydrogenase